MSTLVDQALALIPFCESLGHSATANVLRQLADRVQELESTIQESLKVAASPHGVPPGREDLIDRLVAISSAVAEQDDRAAQAMLGECLRLLNDETALMLASLPQAPQGEQWRPIETAPKDGRTILLGYFNSHGKWRTMRGQWISKEYIDEYWEDPEGVEAGWFETPVEAEDPPNCWPTDPTHWHQLPAPPPLAQGDSQ